MDVCRGPNVLTSFLSGFVFANETSVSSPKADRTIQRCLESVKEEALLTDADPKKSHRCCGTSEAPSGEILKSPLGEITSRFQQLCIAPTTAVPEQEARVRSVEAEAEPGFAAAQIQRGPGGGPMSPMKKTVRCC